MFRLTDKRLRRKLALAFGAVAVAATGAAGTVSAQARNPQYDSARRSGLVGERMDGYLGYVGQPSAELRGIVEDINIKRKAIYAAKARANSATVEEYALTAGCLAIARTSPGEKYQAPDGRWQTRGSDEPVRDSRCP
jgi:uncharacterized protein YdbL (DUF1318 family)